MSIHQKLMYALEADDNPKLFNFYSVAKTKKEITKIATMCATYSNIEMALHGLNLGADPDEVLISSFKRYGNAEPYEIAVAAIKAGADEYICLDLASQQYCINLYNYAMSIMEKQELGEELSSIKENKAIKKLVL